MKKIILSVLIAFSFNLSAFSAENDKKETKVENNNLLTLFQAIDIGVQNSYSLKQSNERVSTAKFQVTESFAVLLPQVSVSTSYGRQDPISSPNASNQRANTFTNQVGVNQLLFSGFKVLDTIKLANVNVDLSQEAYRQSRQDVVNNISIAYFNTLKALQFVRITKESLKNSEEHLEHAKKLEKAGVGIKFDVIRANNQLVNIQMQLSQALNAYEKSKKALNLSMGRSIDFPFELNSEAKIPDLNVEDTKALKDALENRSELKQLKIKQSMDELTTTITSQGNWPTITLNGGYNISDTAVVNTNAINNQNFRYGINMNWPLFDGLSTYAKVQKAQSQVIQDQVQIDQLQQSIILEVKQILLDLKENKERIILAKSGVSLAEEALRLAQIRYQNGVGINLDVLDAQNSLNQAKSNLVNAEFDLNISKMKLYRALGVDI
ncbi:MAG: TolC family protein [Candidatus Sericytochromatia bacterium]